MLSRWKFPFAPHDLGTYPLADGQVYDGGEENEVNQMPVEKSGNLLILVAALGRSEGNGDFARRYIKELAQWAQYLEEKGIDPENQLSTDDFAGHLAHNTNLSVKAIEALGAFAEIARGVGDNQLAHRYEALARGLPVKWQQMAFDRDHYRLAFDQPGTWSQKYNLVWDDLLGLHLFPKSVAEQGWGFYAAHMNTYSLPLDNRKTFFEARLGDVDRVYRARSHTISRCDSPSGCIDGFHTVARAHYGLVRHDNRQADGISGSLGGRRRIYQSPYGSSHCGQV